MEYRRGAHTVFEIHLHLVWITKYRLPALTGEINTRDHPGHLRTVLIPIKKGHVEGLRVH